ncbi:hypothetical protein DFQ28_004333 [Apophysomyces sp. BC1034]|nr:hypothetical protein DFQ30_009160 [Apophysomyces sp. BC1015]KAG0177441.1 hypothetical protein DFQ29_004811 [Apophysomyces sp. BC1021]KAG0188816.1 hypothetical protein DFQ28_004333 [Apophysomyces sp. BC1034]
MRRQWLRQAQWVRQLLPACEGDISLAKRQLIWMKEKVLTDSRAGSFSKSSFLTRKEEEQIDCFVKDRVEHNKPLQNTAILRSGHSDKTTRFDSTASVTDIDVSIVRLIIIIRWETEEWTFRLIDHLQAHHIPRPLRVLDICTGSGCIALGLATHLPKNSVEVTGIDISTDAVELANHNRQIHLDRLCNPVAFQHMDVFDFNLQSIDRYDLIVSNPPYITTDEYANLDPDVKDWEDIRALVAEDDGTAIHKRVIELASYIPKNGLPRLVMEMGINQSNALTDAMTLAGFNDIEVWKDLAHKNRAITGT